MKRTLVFVKRNLLEILRDPLNVIFSLGFPIGIFLLLSAIRINIPEASESFDMFEINGLAPGIAIFGLSFITLFSATLISKDRTGAFLQRLFTTPMRAYEYILGYLLPMLLISIAQCTICYLFSVLLGFKVSLNLLWAILLILPAALFFASLGLLCGSIFNDKQVGGLCGALLTNLTAFLSGAWFDPAMVGGAFDAVARALPFIHAADMQKAILAGNFADAGIELLIVLAYAIVTSVAAVAVFTRKMRT